MIGSFASGANVSLRSKKGTKKIIPLLSIKSSPVDRFKRLRCLNNPINLPYMIVSLASASLTPWWPKLELNILPNLAQSVDSELMDGF